MRLGTNLHHLHSTVVITGKWQQIFSPPLPQTPQTKTCRLRVQRQKNSNTGKISKPGSKNKCVLVFTCYGPGKTLDQFKNPPCGSAYFESRRGSEKGCKTCGVFVDMWIKDLEDRVPELRTGDDDFSQTDSSAGDAVASDDDSSQVSHASRSSAEGSVTSDES